MVPLSDILDVRAFSFDRMASIERCAPSEDAVDCAVDCGGGCGHVHGTDSHDHEHDDSIVSVCVTVSVPLDLHKVGLPITGSDTALVLSALSALILIFYLNCAQLTTWLGLLLWDTPSVQVFRVKGVVSIVDEDSKHILQGVNELFDCLPCSELWQPDEPRTTKVVFIGRHLRRHDLQRGLDTAVAVDVAVV